MSKRFDGGLETRQNFGLAIVESSYVCSSDERGLSGRLANVGKIEVQLGSGRRSEKFSVPYESWERQDHDSAK